MPDNLQYDRNIGTDEPLGNVGEVYQCFNPFTGSFWFIMRMPWASTDANDHFLFDIRDGADTQRLSFFYRASDDKFVLRLNHGDAGAVDIVTSLAQTFSAGDWIIGGVKWKFGIPARCSYSINIGSDATQTSTTDRTAPTTGPQLYIGQSYDNANPIAAVPFYFKFDDVPYSAADFSDLYNTGDGKAFYVGPETILCPGSCCDGQGGNARRIGSSVLDIIGYPKLMIDNSDFNAAKDNIIDDGDGEEAGAWPGFNGGSGAKSDRRGVRQGYNDIYWVSAVLNRGIYKAISVVNNTDYYMVAWINGGEGTLRQGISSTDPTSSVTAVKLGQGGGAAQREMVFRATSTTTWYVIYERIVAGGANRAWSDYWSIVKSLLTDGSFDVGGWTGGLNDNWTAYEDGSPTYTQAGTGQADTNSHTFGLAENSGNFFAQKVATDATGSYYGVKQTQTSLAVGWYTVLGWVKTDTDATDFYLKVVGTTLGTLTSQKFTVNSADGWKRIGFTFYLDTQENVDIMVYTDKDLVNVYFDDLALIDLPQASPSTNTPATEAQSYVDGHF